MCLVLSTTNLQPSWATLKRYTPPGWVAAREHRWPNLYCACAQTAIFDQNSNIAIKFSDPDFVKERNNLAIGRRFQAVTLTFNHWWSWCHKSNSSCWDSSKEGEDGPVVTCTRRRSICYPCCYNNPIKIIDVHNVVACGLCFCRRMKIWWYVVSSRVEKFAMAVPAKFLLVAIIFVFGVTASYADGLYRFTQRWIFTHIITDTRLLTIFANSVYKWYAVTVSQPSWFNTVYC